MQDYRGITAWEANELIKPFPKLNVRKCEEQANSLFTPYLFIRRGREDIELWCSACRTEWHMPYLPRTVTWAEQRILDGQHNERSTCPRCGAGVTFKMTRYVGKMKGLTEYHPVVFLSARRGEIFAQCFWTTKRYYEDGYTSAPLFRQTAAMRFRPGRAVQIQRGWYSDKLYSHVIEGGYGRKAHIDPAFRDGLGCEDYDVFGLEELEKSAFRYCQYDEFWKHSWHWCGKNAQEPKHDALLRYLGICSVYPRQVEMLMKSGMRELVSDLIYNKRKNTAVLNWAETDIRRAFGLNGQEWRAFRDSGADWRRIGDYKRLRKAGVRVHFKELEDCYSGMHHKWKEIMDDCVRFHRTPSKCLRYFGKQDYRSVYEAVSAWADYMDMAKALGWELAEETVRWPRELRRRHDEALEEKNLLLRREQAEWEAVRRAEEAEIEAKAEESLKRRRKKYNFTMGGYMIRIAETAAEIREEGTTLCHCVGGYAQRHLADKLTILFLRREETPSVPYITIEMNGDTLMQIHGYRNDYSGPDPKETHRDLLETWLGWIRNGSPRDRSGEPMLEEKKGATAA